MPSLVPNQLVFRKALNGARAVYSIAKHKRLYLATDGKGGGSWRIKYYPPGSKAQRWLTITNDARHVEFDQVVAKASEILTGLVGGVDPKKKLPVEVATTFDDVFRLWIERHAKVNKKSWQADQDVYRRHIEKRIGREPVDGVTRARIIVVLDEVARGDGKKRKPIIANRCQSLISAVFSWALDEGLVETHPALRIRKRGKEVARSQIMNDVELRTFWQRVEGLPPHVGMIIKLLLLLGCRLSEIVDIEVRELNMSEPCYWTLPKARSKNDEPNVVPLSGLARSLVEDALVASKGSAYLFPARQVAGVAFDKKFISRTCKKIFVEIGQPDMRLHDLRHQAATGMARCGVPMEIRQMVQNQLTGRNRSIGAVYDQHDYFAEKKRALELWERLLLAIVIDEAFTNERY